MSWPCNLLLDTLTRLPWVAAHQRESIEAFQQSLMSWVNEVSGYPEEARRRRAYDVLTACFQNQDNELSLQGIHLSSAPPMHMLPWVRVLNLSYNDLPQLPQRLPPNLDSLNISHNRLQGVPEHLPSSIQRLDCSHNQIVDLPESWPLDLWALNLASNNLTSAPHDLPDSVQNLNLSMNQITALPPLPPNLQELNASDNLLQHIPQDLPPRMTHLNLAGNRLTTLPFALPFALEDLDLAQNLFPNVPPNLPDTLRRLSLSGNQITELPQAWPRLLHILELSGNGLRMVPQNLSWNNLECLDLSHNLLSSLPASLAALPRECRLNVENNPLSSSAIQDFRAALFEQHIMTDHTRGPRPMFSVHEPHNPFMAQLATAPARAAPETLEGAIALWIAQFETLSDQEREAHPVDLTAVRSACSSCTEEEQKPLTTFLRRLRRTADYKDLPKQMTCQVMEVLALAQQNEDFRRRLFESVHEALSSCDDRVAICWGRIELDYLLCCIPQHEPLESRALALIRAFRQILVIHLARRTAHEKRLGDEIETVLFFLMRLRGPLHLPSAPVDMLHPGASGVSESDVDRVRRQVLEDTSSLEEALAILVPNSADLSKIPEIGPDRLAIAAAWATCVRKQYSAAFEKLNAEFSERLEALPAHATSSGGADAYDPEQFGAVGEITREQQEAEQALVREKTAEFLRESPLIKTLWILSRDHHL